MHFPLDPAIRVQQDLTPQAQGAVWGAVSPLVDAWVWQEGQFQYDTLAGIRPMAAMADGRNALECNWLHWKQYV